VLSNISRLIQSFQLANTNYEYVKLDGKYIREKGDEQEEISKEDYLINTFMEEYLAAQSQN
jgi:predicted restriction endonuclease